MCDYIAVPKAAVYVRWVCRMVEEPEAFIHVSQKNQAYKKSVSQYSAYLLFNLIKRNPLSWPASIPVPQAGVFLG